MVDERRRMGDFILTVSARFDLLAGITQSLAGRVGRVELLPHTLEAMLLNGGYPALYDRPLAPTDWFPNYVATYLERDVRQLLAVQDLSQFHRFIRLCAARSGQLPNLAALGADCGVSAVTAAKWLSVLETSYLGFKRIASTFRHVPDRLTQSQSPRGPARQGHGMSPGRRCAGQVGDHGQAERTSRKSIFSTACCDLGHPVVTALH